MAAKQKNRPVVSGKKNVPVTRKPVTQAPRPAVFEPTNTFQRGFWRRHWLPALVLLGLSFALYAAAISFGYVLDDQMVIWQNEYVQKGFAGLRNIFAYDSFMGYFKEQKFLLEGGRYRPLSLATFAIEVGIFGKDHPNIGHLINIILYGLNGILLYRILVGLFPLREGGKWFFSLPFLASLLFVAHPLHVEVVANIKGRDEILALMGSLGALYAALKYFDSGNKAWLWGSAFFLFLGMLAKENAITFLAVIPLTLWFFAKVPAGRSFVATLPLFGAFLLFFFIRYKAMGYVVNHGQSMNDLMNNPFLGMTGGERLATIFMTLGWYIKLLFVPHPLTHDYYPYQVPKIGWTDWRAMLSLLLYLGMGVWAVLNLRKRKLPAYAILYFFLTISIVSNLFVSVGTFMNDRFIYMPSVAFCLLVAWFLTRQLPAWLKEPSDKPYILGAGLAAVVLGLFSYRSYTRVPDWKDKLSLNSSAVRVSTNSARAHMFYATAIYEEQYMETKDPKVRAPLVDSMDVHLRRATQIHPDYTSGWYMRAAVAYARFDLDHQMDRMFNEFDAALHKIPTHTDLRKFIDQTIRYLATSGGNPNKIITFCYREGYEYFYKERKEYHRAIEFLENGLKTQTEDERLLKALVEVYTAAGNPAKAAEMQQRADKAASY